MTLQCEGLIQRISKPSMCREIYGVIDRPPSKGLQSRPLPMNRHRIQRTLCFLVALVVLFVVFQQTADACPTCKQGLADGQENVARGYFWSILFMMAMPFLIFAGLGLYFFLAIRRAKARLQQSAPQSHDQPHVANYVEPEEADEKSEELVEV